MKRWEGEKRLPSDCYEDIGSLSPATQAPGVSGEILPIDGDDLIEKSLGIRSDWSSWFASLIIEAFDVVVKIG